MSQYMVSSQSKSELFILIFMQRKRIPNLSYLKKKFLDIFQLKVSLLKMLMNKILAVPVKSLIL